MQCLIPMEEKEKSQKSELEIISNQIGTTNDNLETNSNNIGTLLESVANLESKHIETVERMKQVSVLVSEYEVKTKEIGQVFKEDQRRK